MLLLYCFCFFANFRQIRGSLIFLTNTTMPSTDGMFHLEKILHIAVGSAKSQLSHILAGATVFESRSFQIIFIWCDGGNLADWLKWICNSLLGGHASLCAKRCVLKNCCTVVPVSPKLLNLPCYSLYQIFCTL